METNEPVESRMYIIGVMLILLILGMGNPALWTFILGWNLARIKIKHTIL